MWSIRGPAGTTLAMSGQNRGGGGEARSCRVLGATEKPLDFYSKCDGRPTEGFEQERPAQIYVP